MVGIISVLGVLFSAVSIAVGNYKGKIILFGDTDLTYHFGKNFFNFNNLYIWNDYFKAGIFDFDKFQAFYFKKIIFAINSVTNLYFFSYLWYFLPIFFYMLSFYFLIWEIQKVFFSGTKFIRLNALLLALFAGINGVFVIYYGQVLVILSLIILNLFLFFLVKNLTYLKQNKKNNYTYIILAGLFLSQLNIYLHTLFLLFYAGLAIAVINYRFLIKYWKSFLKQALFLLLLFIFLNAQWLLPVFSQALFNDTSVKNLIIYNSNLGWNQAVGISKNIFMSDLLKIKSYHIFENYPGFYNIFYFIPMGIVLFFIAKRRKKFDHIFLKILIFLVISLFLSYGIHPISSFFYKILWDHLPFFTAFRTIFKFSFIYLYVMVFLLTYIFATIKKSRDYFVMVLLLAINICFSMNYYFQPEARRNLQQYEIPQYYFDLQSANLADNNKKVGNNIISPQFNWQFQYQWAPAKIDGMNILPYFYGPGVFINGAQDTPDVPYIFNDYFDYNLRNGNFDVLKNLIALRNIKYVTFQDDLRINNDESTPYIVKSNYEKLPKIQKVFSEKFKKEFCDKISTFGKISICQIKNSLFSPIIKVKNKSLVSVQGEKYLDNLTETKNFIPFIRRSEKNHSQVNLVEDNPLILNDLIKLNLSNVNDVYTFGQQNQSKFSENFSNVKTVYPSLKPFQVKNCFYQLECSLFPIQNIEPGKYKLYFVRYLSLGQQVKSKEFFVKIFNGIDDNFINNNVFRLQNSQPIQDVSSEKNYQTVNFISKENNYLGEFNLQGENIILKTISDQFFSEGRFYLVREENHQEKESFISPTLEFKKINPTKFRVRIHNAKGIFPLVFSENFDQNWKIYLSQKWQTNNNSLDPKRYLISEGNNLDQASLKEANSFIQEGLISDFGEGKGNVNFISKNIQGVIQNNNLPDGKKWETWLKKSINSAEHFEDEGYSSGWVINTQEICKNNSDCIKNEDGTYDFEIVIEFWPQKMLYFGLFISVAAFFGCFIMLIILKKKND